MHSNQKALRGIPAFVIDDYPHFVDFVSAFYEWDSRNGFLTEEERNQLGDDTYRTVGTGVRSDLRWRDRNLERRFSFFETADGGLFELSDGALFENEIHLPGMLQWYSQMGNFPKVGLGRISSYNNFITNDLMNFKSLGDFVFKVKASNVFTDFRDLDDPRFIKLLKQLYMLKGTKGMITLFFNMFFGESVSIENTKTKIAVIDDNFILDGVNRTRDDVEYSEFTYVVSVSRDVDVYSEIFNKIFLKHFHPAGFNVILRRG